MENVSERKGWLTRNWKWFVPVVGLGTILVCVGCVAIFVAAIFGSIKSSDIYQQALTRTQENTEAAEALGTPIRTGFWVSGSIKVSGPSGSADLAIPVSGPKGSGTLYVVAIKSAGLWEFTTLQLVLKGSDDRIDVLADQKSLSVPGDCGSPTEPTEQDVKYVLEFTGDTFESSDWQRSFTVEPNRVSVTWLSQGQDAVVFKEYLIYSCGYTQADVDQYFSEENFEAIIFSDYENLRSIATCTDIGSDLTLHEFTAQIQETDYVIRYWIKLDSKTRVLDMMIVFPAASELELDRYAREIFPELSSCQR